MNTNLTSLIRRLVRSRNILKILILTVSLNIGNIAYASTGHDEGAHEDSEHQEAGHEERHNDEEASIKLNAKQLAVANIVVKAIQPQSLATQISAPGEIMLNEYKTTSVTPRVPSQVVERHVKLGDAITIGQPLVTLSSVEMATAQGDLLVSYREWQRVKKLGRKVVSAQRYTKARVNHEQAKARVIAYGMTAKQVESFLKSGDASKANGSFQLLSSQAGTVIFDRFIVGELIKPGTKLFIISDETVLWVEAKLTPAQAMLVRTGSSANITVGDKSLTGKVVQVHHALDEGTRTLGVRIEIANPDDQLHSGVFVQVQISSMNTEQVLAVPLNAVLRSPDGDWEIFIEHESGKFESEEVELLKTVAGLAVIKGIEPGTHVVTQGAFFVQSELAKAGFSVHNH